MRIRQTISLLLCISILTSLIPVQTFAIESAKSTTATISAEEITNSLGEIGGYLAGNALTTSNLFAEDRFNWPTGLGFAAERGNNLKDVLKGLNSSIVGDNNAANGADRKIINRDKSITWIQTKYHSTAGRSVSDAFDENTGLYRYMDGDGKPMQLEVPADQHAKAIESMRTKIKEGRVPGVTDPDDAENLIRKGNLTFKQAQNIAKAGNIDSLKYDAANGVITASYAAGISFVLDFACCVLNGVDTEEALKNAGLNGLKTGGVVFATYVISSQLAKAGMTKAMIPTAEAIAKALGDEVCEAIVRKAGVETVLTNTKAAAQIIAKEMIVDGVMLVVLTGVDVSELFRGRISKEELLKNLTVTIISIGVGTAGGYGGAALGTLIAPGLGTSIGAILGSLAAGSLSALAAEAIIAPYYESDAEEMFKIITDEFTVLCIDYLINEEEGNHIVDKLSSVLVGDVLKDMYASENRQQFTHELLEPLFIEEVEQRPTIITPTEEELRYKMKETLRGIVFIH
ncbi:MAG: hypothetical protein E7432_07075 [Ruminococcaceae bacterium]|nr:hypothetical protein [Oscillospiraceae bacterium]